MKQPGIDICIDFDGTCVTHEYPGIGRSIGAEAVLKELVANGHRLILFTMRSDRKTKTIFGSVEERYLTEAVEWFRSKDIDLFGIQSNPSQGEWTESPKAFGQLYIDDAALGCPLVYPAESSGERPYANWVAIRKWLQAHSIL
jgi:hypothetical protein